MESNKQLEKNILDLEYNAELQTCNAVLIAMTTGLLGFFGTFVWFPDRLLVGFVVLSIVEGVLFMWLKKCKDNMHEMIVKLRSLKE